MEQFWEIFWSAIGIIVTGLVSWGVATLVAWLNSKIKDKKIAGYATAITNIIGTAVKDVFQTYVDGLKKKNAFTTDCQKEALAMAVSKAKQCLNGELMGYIQANYGDAEQYIVSLIESTIYSLKSTTGRTVHPFSLK